MSFDFDPSRFVHNRVTRGPFAFHVKHVLISMQIWAWDKYKPRLTYTESFMVIVARMCTPGCSWVKLTAGRCCAVMYYIFEWQALSMQSTPVTPRTSVSYGNSFVLTLSYILWRHFGTAMTSVRVSYYNFGYVWRNVGLGVFCFQWWARLDSLLSVA